MFCSAWLAAASPPRLRGLLAFGDALKPTAVAAIQALQVMGVRTVLLSGDNHGSAQAVASALGITDVRAEVLREVLDARGQQRNLHFRRAGVVRRALVVGDDLVGLFSVQRHF